MLGRFVRAQSDCGQNARGKNFRGVLRRRDARFREERRRFLFVLRGGNFEEREKMQSTDFRKQTAAFKPIERNMFISAPRRRDVSAIVRQRR